MLGTTIIASVIAFLGGAAAYYSWNQNKAISVVAALIGTIAAAVAVILAFVGAVLLIFRIIPILLLVGLLWLLWRRFADRSSGSSERSTADMS